jgi:hypothetical protein
MNHFLSLDPHFRTCRDQKLSLIDLFFTHFIGRPNHLVVMHAQVHLECIGTTADGESSHSASSSTCLRTTHDSTTSHVYPAYQRLICCEGTKK